MSPSTAQEPLYGAGVKWQTNDNNNDRERPRKVLKVKESLKVPRLHLFDVYYNSQFNTMETDHHTTRHRLPLSKTPSTVLQRTKTLFAAAENQIKGAKRQRDGDNLKHLFLQKIPSGTKTPPLINWINWISFANTRHQHNSRSRVRSIFRLGSWWVLCLRLNGLVKFNWNQSIHLIRRFTNRFFRNFPAEELPFKCGELPLMTVCWGIQRIYRSLDSL